MSHIGSESLSYISMSIRYILPILAVIILTRCFRSLLQNENRKERWGSLSLSNGMHVILNHWENVIGRSRSSDVYMKFPTLSRTHAAVIRDDKGDWRIYDIRQLYLSAIGGWFQGNSSKQREAIIVNGEAVEGKEGAPIENGDVISLGGMELVFSTIDEAGEIKQALADKKPGSLIKQGITLFFLTVFQLFLGIQLCISMGGDMTTAVLISTIALILVMWLSYSITRALRRTAFEVETLAFFLCTIGMAVCISSSPTDIYRQIVILIAGVVLFFTLGWFLRDLTKAKDLRKPIAVIGLLLLIANLIFSRPIYGARGWLEIGAFSFQPSEFVKIALIFVGAATLDRLFAKRNLSVFVGFAGACVVVLTMTNDFGSALVFFVTYLVIAFMRSGDIATIILSIGSAGFAGFLALRLRSHVSGRFVTWGNAWDYIYTGGFQQTRAMSAAAGGGLFGVGAGEGWLKNVFAADSDLVFGFVCEELGLIIAAAAFGSIILFALFSVKSTETARSSFYAIGACAAASILVFQMSLNVLGSMDILPFTGITFPFVSRGGSSLIASWGLLAFIKAADTRRSASIFVKTPRLLCGNDNGKDDEVI